METPPNRIHDDLRPPAEPGVTYRRAAVLLLLYSRAGEDYIIFTKRTDTVEHHKGQISLPGGAQDPTDPDTVYTALRETEEELGIDKSAIRVVATLRDIYVWVSGFVVTPVVARLESLVTNTSPLKLIPNPDEVAEIIEVPLSVLRDESMHRIEPRTRDNITYHIHYYTYGSYEIWGATARIIYEFLNTPVEEL